MVSGPAAARPRSVTVALGLIIASYAASSLITVVRLLTSAPTAQQPSRWLTLVLVLVVLGLVAGLLAALVYRRRWAWWLWLALSVLSLPFVWSGFQRDLDRSAFSAASYVVANVANIAALVLLVLRPAREWYGVGRKPGEPSPWRWSDNPKEP